MKKSAIVRIVILLIMCSSVCFAQESGVISILRPSENATKNEKEIIEGRVLESFVRRLQLRIEPFVPEKDDAPVEYTVIVRNGHFRKEVKLFPGLNIIRIATSGGKHETSKAVFRIHDEKKKDLMSELEKWGTSSPVVFAAPRDLRIGEDSPTIRGVTTDPSLETIEVVVVNVFDFFMSDALPPLVEERSIGYMSIGIKDLQFDFKPRLRVGLNMIMAKPAGRKSQLAEMQVKSLVYDRISDKVTIDGCTVENANVVVEGRITNSPGASVRAVVVALGREDAAGAVQPVVVFEKDVERTKKGMFSLSFSLSEEVLGYQIVSPPTVYIEGGKEIASYTILNWQ